jgi:hypothetical protein
MFSQTEIMYYVGIVAGRIMILDGGMTRLIEGTSWGFIILVLCGLFMIAGGGFNSDWYMTNRRAQFFVKLLGRTGARVFYVLLGLVLIVWPSRLEMASDRR